MKRVGLAIALVACAASLAPAIARAEPPARLPHPFPPKSNAPPGPPKPASPYGALAISLGATAATWVGMGLAIDANNWTAAYVALGAVTLAPSAGHWYAGRYLTVGLATRAVGVAFTLTGFDRGIGLGCDRPEIEPGPGCGPGNGWLTVGVLTFAAGTIIDIATAPSAARAANRERGLASLQVTPVLAPQHTGVAVIGSF